MVFHLLFGLCLCDCEVLYTYLECGSNKGEPNGIAGVDDGADCSCVPAAISGCKKFLRWSTRSWCCAKHLPKTSGSASSWSYFQ